MPGPTPAVGDFLQIRTDCQLGDQLSQNVLHYEVTAIGGAGGMNLTQIASAMSANVATAYKGWMATVSTYSGLTVQNLTPPITTAFVGTTGAGIGTGGTVSMARQVSGLIQTKTALGGRANHGRVYVGFPTTTFQTAEGELTGAGTAALALVALALGPNVALAVGPLATTLTLAVRHPNTPGPIIVPVWTRVISLQATALLATQRRRGDFGATNLPAPP